ncbi:4649_t:CDS:2, partial [Acaulospora colombiana]
EMDWKLGFNGNSSKYSGSLNHRHNGGEMSDHPNPLSPPPRRLLRSLPTPGASRRIKKQPASTTEQNNQSAEKDTERKENGEDNSVTPKAPDLPQLDSASTPKVPTLKLNDEPLPEAPGMKKVSTVDEERDAELRKKFLEMQIHDTPNVPILKLNIPKAAKLPPKPIQRKMARGSESPPEEGAESSNPKQPDFKAVQRRLLREKRALLGLQNEKSRLRRPPPPDPTSIEQETKRKKSTDLEESKKVDTSQSGDQDEDLKAKQKEAKDKIKKLAYLMAKDIREQHIPAWQLKRMAKGKTEEETKARKKVLELALRIVQKQEQKAKEEDEKPPKDTEVPENEEPKARQSPGLKLSSTSSPDSKKDGSMKQPRKSKGKGKELAIPFESAFIVDEQRLHQERAPRILGVVPTWMMSRLLRCSGPQDGGIQTLGDEEGDEILAFPS